MTPPKGMSAGSATTSWRMCWRTASVPVTKLIIHLGATSCYVGDNTIYNYARRAVSYQERLVSVISALCVSRISTGSSDARVYALQPAQLTTVGKRDALDKQLLMDLDELEYRISSLCWVQRAQREPRQLYGAIDNDSEKVKKLDYRRVGFPAAFCVGQTYSRKYDSGVRDACGIAQSASKFATDLGCYQQEIESLRATDSLFGNAVCETLCARAHLRLSGMLSRIL